MDAKALEGGFAEAPQQSAQAFRGAMTAMARPGTLVTLEGAMPPAPLSPAAGALLLTLCDTTTPLHLAGRFDTEAARAWVTFHCGAPLVGATEAEFALGDWQGLAPLSRYGIGTSDYPDRSATLIVEVDRLEARGATLSGPGIRETAALSLPEVAAFQANSALFPLGLDFYFTKGTQAAALPRSTKVS